MAKENISIRMEQEKIVALEALAAKMDRDRSYLINEAVDAYIALRQWQIEETERAIAEADVGEFATAKEVRAAFDAFKNS